MFHEEYDEYDPDSTPPTPAIWWRVFASFDEFFGATSERLGEFMEWVEQLFHVVVGWLLYAATPWRWFHKKPELEASEDMDSLEPPPELEISETQKRVDSVLSVVIGGPLAVFYHVSETVGDLAERYMPRRIFWPIYWLLDGLIAAYEFSMDWWFSRDFRRLVWSLPAILLGISLGGSALLGFLQTEGRKISHYETLMSEAEESKNFEQKLFARRKLEQLGCKHLDRTDFERAIELSKAEQHLAAYKIMQKLAATEEPGFLPAHLWIAGGLLDGLVKPNGDLLTEATAHVDHALELEPENQLARRLNVELQVRQGKMDQHILAEMEDLSQGQSDLHAGLAHEYRLLGDKTAAVKAARAAIRDYEKRRSRRDASEAPSTAPRKADSLTALGYLRIAESYMLVGDAKSELRIFEEALLAFPDSAELQRVAHARNVREFAQLDLHDLRAAELAVTICQREPKNRDVIRQLVRGLLATEDATLPTADAKKRQVAAWKIVRQLQSEDLLSSEVLVFAGDFHLINNRPKKAEGFYKEACKFDPKASFAWNNLASIWSTSLPYRLDNALKAANRAIELNPDPRFYDTRGQIFLKLKRWQDSINDLETAINGTIPNPSDAHRSLIKCYNALGQSELAEAHQKLMASFSGSTR